VSTRYEKAGKYCPLTSGVVEHFGDESLRIVVSAELLLGLASLPSWSLDALMGFAGDRMLMIPDAHKQITLCINNSPDAGAVAAAKRLRALADHLPERDDLNFIPGGTASVARLSGAIKEGWRNSLPEPILTSAVQQTLVVLRGVDPAIAVSQCMLVFGNTAHKKPDRVIGIHHALAYLARYGHGISGDEAWADAIALTELRPPIPFFGHPIAEGPVSDELKKGMDAYIAGSNDSEF
jgi:hypothetical protein